jgi:carbamate kinase
MSPEILVIALGGNAIKQAHEEGTTEEQFANVDKTAAQAAGIVKAGFRVVLTHGNGPQAGALLIQQEEARSLVPPQTLAACGAMTQGWIGWMLQNRLSYHLEQEGLTTPVGTVVTQVEVRLDDPDFQNPSKPVGPFYSKEEALELAQQKGYCVKEVRPGKAKGWRRVVASPEPVDIVEHEVVKALLAAGMLVIASGGGGIPVARNGDGSFVGVEAVIDKDRAGFKLAESVGADRFLILTDVERACLHYGSPRQKPLDRLVLEEAERYLAEGHFLAGSMGPKIQAAIRFVRWRGKEAVISSLDRALDALAGRTGTHILP